MSAGRVALERVGIEVDQYFASEIDQNAIKISKKNYPDIIQIGDVTAVKAEDLPKIDLLIAGSPCQGFSREGLLKNFDDPRSRLFFEFVRLLNECRAKNPELKFLLENVHMKQEWRDVISEAVEVQPIDINSNRLSAQNRPRLYWTNIEQVTLPDDLGLTFKDIRDHEGPFHYLKDEFVRKVENHEYVWKEYYKFVEDDQKVQCLRASVGTNAPKTWENGRMRWLTLKEWEALQTLPPDYTAAEGLSRRHRQHALGNGWTVDVIAHIFKGLQRIR